MINSVIGAGIFGLPAAVYRLTGIYSVAAFFICALVIMVFILCFAEVSSRFEKTGGPYAYAYEAFGPFPAFLTGWLLLFTRVFSYGTLINLLVTYAAYFYPPLGEEPARVALILAITSGLAMINYAGIRNTTQLSNVLTIGKLLPLTIFIIAGLFFLQPALLRPGPLPSLPSFSQAVLLLVFAFGGFESILVNTGEVRNPVKTLPFALITSTLIIAAYYCFIQVVSIGTLPTLENSQKPLAEAASAFMGSQGGSLMAAGAILSILGTLNVIILSGSRLPYAFSTDGLLPSLFSRVHSRFRTPGWSIGLMFLLSATVAIAWSFFTALTISVIIRVTVYLVVCGALLQLRRTPGPKKYYKAPAGKLLAIAGILLSGWLLSAAGARELRSAGIFLGIGVLVYFLQKQMKRKSGGDAEK